MLYLQKIKVSVPSGPVPGPSMYQPGAPVPPYLANGPSDPAANAYYNPNQQPVSTGQWGPPSAGYGAGFGAQSVALGSGYPQGPQGPPYPGQQGHQGGAPGALPLYNPRNEQTAGYNGYPVAQQHPHNEKAENPFEDVKV